MPPFTPACKHDGPNHGDRVVPISSEDGIVHQQPPAQRSGEGPNIGHQETAPLNPVHSLSNLPSTSPNPQEIEQPEEPANTQNQASAADILSTSEARPSSKEVPKLWECGQPYNFPIPGPQGDPWETLLKPLEEQNKAQCDAWKDEIQYLLIFAGLFSAVVTAFVVQTYPNLQPDPNDTIIQLLSRISDNLGSSLNTSNPVVQLSAPPPFSPASSTIRINIYFFVSLILSLATVLIGIISLQWLREHQSYIGSFTPENRFSAIHMRLEALEKWRVPEVLSALPVLLQVALVLFFIGVIELLRGINIDVAIPVIVIIGLTLAFLILTTILPTLQAFILHHPYLKINENVPVPCPYKSPQAHAFRAFITSSRLIFYTLSYSIASVYWLGVRVYLLPSQVIRRKPLHGEHLPTVDNSGTHFAFDYMAEQVYEFWRFKSSFDFDHMWLTIRDGYFQSSCKEGSWLFQGRYGSEDPNEPFPGAVYDAICGVSEEFFREDVNADGDVVQSILTAYHCGLHSPINKYQEVESIRSLRARNEYIARLLKLGDSESTPLLAPFSETVKDPHPVILSVLADENMFLLLYSAHRKLNDLGLSSPQISRPLAEVNFRLLGHLYKQLRPMHGVEVGSKPPEVIFKHEAVYVEEKYTATDQLFTIQWALTIHSYFKIWENQHVDVDVFLNSFHAHPFIREYMWNFWIQVHSEFTKKHIHPNVIPLILETLRLIDDALIHLLQDEERNQRSSLDCLFYPAAMHAQMCQRRFSDHEDLREAVERNILRLGHCKDRIAGVGRIDNLERIFGRQEQDESSELGRFMMEWWTNLFPGNPHTPPPASPQVAKIGYTVLEVESTAAVQQFAAR